MKKKLLILGVLAATLLAGCNDAKTPSKGTLDPAMIAKNVVESKTTNNLLYYGETNNYYGTNFRYIGNGLAIDNEKNGKYDFVNVITGEILASKVSTDTNYEYFQDTNFGFFLLLDIGDEIDPQAYCIIDPFGNVLGTYHNLSYFYDIYSTKVGDVYFVTVRADSYYYYKYVDGAPVEISAIPSIVSEDDSSHSVGSLYIDQTKLDLKEFGHDGYYLSRNSELATTFKNDGTAVATFAIPHNAHYGIVGDKIIVQEQFETSEYSDEFDYIDGHHKYVINTYTVDYLTGKTEPLEANYYIGHINPYKDADGIYTYGLAPISPILKNKVLGEQEIYLVNKDFKFVQDVTGEHIDSFKKLNNGYFYNTASKVLYDTAMHPVTYLTSLTVNFYDNVPNYIIVSNGSKYGALNNKGVVVADLEYDSLVSGNGTSLIFKKGSDYYLVKESVRAKKINDVDCTNVSGNIFKANELAEDQIARYFNEKEDILNLDVSDVTSSTVSSFKVSFPICNYSAVILSYLEGTSHTSCLIVSNKDVLKF